MRATYSEPLVFPVRRNTASHCSEPVDSGALLLGERAPKSLRHRVTPEKGGSRVQWNERVGRTFELVEGAVQGEGKLSEMHVGREGCRALFEGDPRVVLAHEQ